MKVEGLNGTGSELSPDHLSSSSETQSALLINGQDTQDCHVPGGFCPQAIDVRDTPNQEVLSTNAQRARQSRRSRKKSTPSQLRAQDAIQVINATFAACVGKHLNNETRFAILPMFLPQRYDTDLLVAHDPYLYTSFGKVFLWFPLPFLSTAPYGNYKTRPTRVAQEFPSETQRAYPTIQAPYRES